MVSMRVGQTPRKNGARGREYMQLALRVPPNIYEAIASNAVASNRTMNAEIVHVLSVAYGEQVVGLTSGATPAEESRADRIEALLARIAAAVEKA